MARKQQMKLPKQQQNAQEPIWQNKKKSDLKVALCFLLPSLIGVMVFIFIPFIDVIRRSFFGAMSGEFVGLKNYATIFQNDAFKLAGGNTLKFTLICIPLLVIASLGLALLINAIGKKAQLFKMTFLLPMAIPVASVVLLWQVLFHQNGLLSRGIIALGGQRVDWMKTDWAFWILVASYLWRNIGYDMVLWLAGLSTISPAIYEAAKVDGASSWQQFTKITIPQLLPTLFTIVVLSLLNSFKVFREAYLIAGDYPHDSMYMLQHLFNNWFVSLDIDKLSAAATIVAGVILILILLLQRTWEGDED
ncbi:MAG: sugar ABC transporter permease [Clostridiales bacterium]|uniref:Sugar ABC transporter permease n=1 Tax=Zhenhengia yiwuensis TaxID=2763666 RepID=A0A926EJB9_9FIRM|nr:sugar ABC transporter permease [Zhenhengia yiwuensis]MBC8579212.1 sugar ABC transporter permease [Zhenhengia yiwuensis]MDU6855147.1 sugar ABC transporter permease [Clostridiales bacterium]MDU6974962.1 sugar ABC transporter permease [Clostridiales bacterium]